MILFLRLLVVDAIFVTWFIWLCANAPELPWHD